MCSHPFLPLSDFLPVVFELIDYCAPIIRHVPIEAFGISRNIFKIFWYFWFFLEKKLKIDFFSGETGRCPTQFFEKTCMGNCLKIEKMLKLGKTWKILSGNLEQGSGRLKFAVTFNYNKFLPPPKNLSTAIVLTLLKRENRQTKHGYNDFLWSLHSNCHLYKGLLGTQHLQSWMIRPTFQ